MFSIRLRWWFPLVFVVAVIAATGWTAPSEPQAEAAGSYVSMVPARLLDTRPGEVTADGQFQGIGSRAAKSTLELQVTGRVGIPADADAVVLNVTVAQPAAAGYATVYPCGVSLPTASNLNYTAGQTIPNTVIAKIGTDGKVCLYTFAAAHFIVDVSGYFPAGTYASMVPARLLDTRPGELTADGQFQGIGTRAARSTLRLDIHDRVGIPTVATAVVLNVTVTRPTAAGFATVFPNGVDRPTASNLNFLTGNTIANAVIARVGIDGDVCLYTLTPAHYIVDISGYFIGTPPPAGDANCTAITPPPTTTSTTTTAPPATTTTSSTTTTTAPPASTTTSTTSTTSTSTTSTSTSTTTTTSTTLPPEPIAKIVYAWRNQIYTINPDGTGQVQLTTSDKNYWPRWSPDGTRIAYIHETSDGAHSLWVMNGNGTNKQHITDQTTAWGPAWSPDGQWLAFVGPGESLMRIRSTTPYGAPVAFLGWQGDPNQPYGEIGVLGTPVWSVDDEIVYYSPYGDSSPDHYILAYDVDTQEERIVFMIGGSCCGIGTVSEPAISPDGTTIGFTYSLSPPSVPIDTGPLISLHSYPSMTQLPFTTFTEDGQIAFSKTDDRVAFMNDATGTARVYIANADGSNRRSLTNGYQPDWQPLP